MHGGLNRSEKILPPRRAARVKNHAPHGVCFCTAEFSTENWIAFQLFDAYEKEPTKRRADYLQRFCVNEGDWMTKKYGNLFCELNVAAKERTVFAGKRITLDLPRSFGDKVQKWGLLGALQHKLTNQGTKPPADAFEDFRKLVVNNMADVYARFSVFEQQVLRQPWVDEYLPVLRRDLTAAGLNPNELGLW